MAHKKAGGSPRNGRDSGGQRLGIKIFGGEEGKVPGQEGAKTQGASGESQKAGGKGQAKEMMQGGDAFVTFAV